MSFRVALVVCSVLGLGNCLAVPYPYHNNASRNQATNQINNPVVFFGDSITAMWPGNSGGIWESKYAPITSNFAIGGHQTANTIQRIRDEGVLNGYNSKVAMLLIGTNNLWDTAPPETIATIANDIRTIIDLILERQTQAKILLLGILPRNGVGIATRAEEVNAIIASYDDGNRIRYLNMKEQFQTSIGNVRPGLYSDGLHLTAAGYQVWDTTMGPLFQELLG